MSGSRLSLWGAVAGIAVGSTVAAALLVGGTLQVPVKRDTSDAHVAFLDAWKRSRTGTFVVTSDFRRTMADGRVLSSETELVQRPPDRIERQFGGVNGTVGGHPISCGTDPTAHYKCVPAAATAPAYADALNQELDTLRSYFVPPPGGAVPLYAVSPGRDEGCFELYQVMSFADAPYGHHARFCFDAATGALRLLERDLDGSVTEVQEATSISTDVLSSDFDLSANDDFGTRMDLGDPNLPVPGTDPLGTQPPGTDGTGTVPPATGPPGTEPPATQAPGNG